MAAWLGAVVGVVAFGATSCGSSLSDAATLTFRDSRGKQTVHITRNTLLARVDQSVSNKLFRDLASQSGFSPGDGGAKGVVVGLRVGAGPG